MFAFCQWLENSSWATAIHQSLWLFPLLETAHLFGIILLVGATSALDLRLIGWGMRREPVSRMAARLLPWAWAGLAIQVTTGFFLFASEASRCFENEAFRIKMIMLLLAGLNALIFHQTVYRRVAAWDEAKVTPLGAKFAGCCSILLWFGIVAAGRWIAFL
ncbi:MAG TPA: DUF6644 family protein [Candidatus Acidoferrales bacterium]|jgi:hypothetical protein|nr:DUF6644 family protein [Candidatus Acidoferrales bacterium]